MRRRRVLAFELKAGENAPPRLLRLALLSPKRVPPLGVLCLSLIVGLVDLSMKACVRRLRTRRLAR
jgi:hypothetical protein